jgi:hypothetical protein
VPTGDSTHNIHNTPCRGSFFDVARGDSSKGATGRPRLLLLGPGLPSFAGRRTVVEACRRYYEAEVWAVGHTGNSLHRPFRNPSIKKQEEEKATGQHFLNRGAVSNSAGLDLFLHTLSLFSQGRFLCSLGMNGVMADKRTIHLISAGFGIPTNQLTPFQC